MTERSIAMTVQSSPRRRTESPTRKSRGGSSVAQGVAGFPSMLATGRSTRLPIAATVGHRDGHMAHKSALSSTGTSATMTPSALGHTTMAMRTRTKSHGKVSRAELRVGRELGGEVLYHRGEVPYHVPDDVHAEVICDIHGESCCRR